MEIFIAGKGKIRLRQADFVAQGGEASIYARGDRAYKIYTDPAKMLPAAKLQQLAALAHPSLIRPEEAVLDAQGSPVGYAMRRVQDATVLCQTFNRAFRDRKGLTPDAVIELVRKLQAGVQHVHDHGMLIVDLNEMNFLLDQDLQEILFIDMDSYQTPGFPATALMESIRDRHAAGFSRETDWFSFGIVSFQMFVGIHPYKGKHPALAGLDARMQANVSVLNPAVSVPAVCYPFSVIPPAYLDWYRAVFEDGKRLAPPADLRPALTLPAAPALAPQGERVRVELLGRFPADVVLPLPALGPQVALTTAGLSVRGKLHPVGADARLGMTPRTQHAVMAWIEGGALRFYDVAAGGFLDERLEGEALTAYRGALYVKQGAALSAVEFVELPSGVRAALKPVANVMEQATLLGEGVALQNMLGAAYATVLPEAGRCFSIRVPELDGYRLIDARFDGGVLMAVGLRDGRYDRLVLRFDPSYGSYDFRSIPDVSDLGINFVTLPSGVCVHLDACGELELFPGRKGAPDLKSVADTALAGMRLHADGAQVLASRGDAVYRLELRK